MMPAEAEAPESLAHGVHWGGVGRERVRTAAELMSERRADNEDYVVGRERDIRTNTADADALAFEKNRMTLRYRVGSGGMMWACTAFSAFFFISWLSLLLWSFDPGADQGAAAAGSGSWATPAAASNCTQDAECGTAGECDLSATWPHCVYSDELWVDALARRTSGRFTAAEKAQLEAQECNGEDDICFSPGLLCWFGIGCAAVALYLGGTRGGCKYETAAIIKGAEDWTVTIQRTAWKCYPLKTMTASLEPGSYVRVERYEHEDTSGFTIMVEDGGVLDEVGAGGWFLWGGAPLSRGEAEEMALRCNEFGIDPVR